MQPDPPALVPTWTELLPRLRDAAELGRFHHHVSMNANKLALVRSDPEVAGIVARAHTLAADGVMAQMHTAQHGHGWPQRIPGVELAARLLEEAAVRRWRVALVGARAEVVGEVGRQWADRGVHIVHLEDGYDPDEDAVIARIRAAEPQLVLAALGSPRAEAFLDRAHIDALCLGVGGSFDVWAGAVPRAPAWACALGLEGVVRVARDPRKRLGPFVRSLAQLVRP
jgi:N-acetylglucosaminyldiphosphoundecaprenol N-acetyl-beta-D-mannosaminyltransferase